jgi:hypothetical protein
MPRLCVTCCFPLLDSEFLWFVTSLFSDKVSFKEAILRQMILLLIKIKERSSTRPVLGHRTVSELPELSRSFNRLILTVTDEACFKVLHSTIPEVVPTFKFTVRDWAL